RTVRRAERVLELIACEQATEACGAPYIPAAGRVATAARPVHGDPSAPCRTRDADGRERGESADPPGQRVRPERRRSDVRGATLGEGHEEEPRRIAHDLGREAPRVAAPRVGQPAELILVDLYDVEAPEPVPPGEQRLVHPLPARPDAEEERVQVGVDRARETDP